MDEIMNENVYFGYKINKEELINNFNNRIGAYIDEELTEEINEELETIKDIIIDKIITSSKPINIMTIACMLFASLPEELQREHIAMDGVMDDYLDYDSDNNFNEE